MTGARAVYSPRVDWGLLATGVMLKAKGGRLSPRDVQELMLATLQYVGDVEALREAVIDFVHGCAVNPVTAALHFEQAISTWLSTLAPCDPQLAELGQFAWQQRVDING